MAGTTADVFYHLCVLFVVVVRCQQVRDEGAYFAKVTDSKGSSLCATTGAVQLAVVERVGFQSQCVLRCRSDGYCVSFQYQQSEQQHSTCYLCSVLICATLEIRPTAFSMRYAVQFRRHYYMIPNTTSFQL